MRSQTLVIIICGLALFPTMGQPTWALESDPAAFGLPVKRIEIEGLKKTREYIVTRELTTKLGQPCLEENLTEDQRRLLDLDIFSDVQSMTTVEQDSAVVNYHVVETFPILPSIGLRISDENGLSVGAGVKSPNLFGKDIYTSARFLVGGENTLELELENPWFAGNRFGYRVEYFHRNRQNAIADFYETADEAYLWIRFPVYHSSGYQLAVIPSWSFLSIMSDKDGVTLNDSNRDNVNRIGIAFSHDSRDKITDTRSGWRNELQIAQEMRIFSSDTKFTQMDLDLRRYQPTFWERQTLSIFALTTLRTGTVGEDVASWQQFGIGGTNTVRGWEFAARKGKNQFISFAEYSWTIMEPRLFNLPWGIKYRGGLQLAAFGDLGIGWDESREFATSSFIGGGGVGVRLLLPIISVVRFDLGMGQQGMGVRLHIGSWEKAEMARKRVR